MSDPNRSTLSVTDVRDWFAKAKSKPLVVASPTAFHLPAAVLDSFTLADLRTSEGLGPPERQDALRLMEDSVALPDSSPVRWSLKHDARSRALAACPSLADLLHARDANQSVARPTPLQLALDSYIRRTADPIGAQGGELEHSVQAIAWLQATHFASELHLPSLEEAQLRLDLFRLLAPLRMMVGLHFRGRRIELEQLRAFIDLPSGGTAPKPFVLYGFGGSGKTTLLTKLLLEHAEESSAGPRPFVFLDFDRPTLATNEMAVLLLDALRQLAAQSKEVRERAIALTRLIESLLRGKDEEDRGGILETQHGRSLLYQFAEIATDPVWRGAPLLFAFDTFEEVQYRSKKSVETTWRFLAELREVVPTLRAVVSGRAPVSIEDSAAPASVELKIDALDEDAAISCLTHFKVELDTARFVYLHIGGNPLALRLVADLIRLETERGFRDFANAQFAERMGDELTQAILFRRVLGHIKTEDVRKLAHPGLILRRITPELIMRVLAGPCEIEVPTLDRAIQLWQELTRETSLVIQDGDGACKHRPELRRQMIQLLRSSKSKQVQQIHHGAIDFYGEHADDASRAEELYHRLCLNQPRAELDARWRPGLEEYLTSAREELPEEALLYLASTAGYGLEALGVSGQDWAQQELVVWERKTAQWAAELIQQDRFEEVIKELRSRPERSPGSQLYLVQARVLRALGENWEAFHTLDRAFTGWPSDRQSELIDLMLLRARLYFDLRHSDGPQDEALADLLAESGTAGQRLEAAVLKARRTRAEADLLVLTRVVEAWESSDLRAVTFVAREAASLLLPLRAGYGAAAKIIRAVGLPQLSSKDLERCVDEIAVFSTDGTGPWRQLLRSGSRQEIAERVATVLERAVRDQSSYALSSDSFRQLAKVLSAPDDAHTRRQVRTQVAHDRYARLDVLFTRLPRAILAAYPNEHVLLDLAYKANLSLSSLAQTMTGDTMVDFVRKLVEEAERTGRLELLLTVLEDETAGAHGEEFRSFKQALQIEGSDMTGIIQVKGPQYQQLVQALVDAFPNTNSLGMMLQYRLSKSLAQLAALPNSLPQVAFEVIERSNAEGWTGQLIAAARDSNPTNPALLKLAQDFALTAATGELERKVRDDLSFLDITQWRERLGQIEGRVCRVETPTGFGTGFLVGPDLLLTNYHVMRSVIDAPQTAKAVLLRFDYKQLADGTTLSPGTEYKLAANWLVDHSPYSKVDTSADSGSQVPQPDELDYALLRLEGEPGRQPVGGDKAEPTANPRGWIEPKPLPYSVTNGAPIFIVQHPEAKPLKLALDTKGVLGVNANGTRVRYVTNTEPGSSGSPVFNENWELIALHHSGDRRIVPTYNQGIPFAAILSLLAGRNVRLGK